MPHLARNLACPLDGSPLSGDQTLKCEHGHHFDVARQGYVNLLPVQNKKSKEPGDSKEMVEARGRFLDAGFYAPIADLVVQTMLRHWPKCETPCIVDAGCGEGYYLNYLAQALQRDQRSASLIGLDIAKPAVIAAARRNKKITWLVASNNNPALQAHSVDIVLCMFGFPMYDAFAKILKPGGILIMVEAAENHLIELREVIYPQVRKNAPPSVDRACENGFVLSDSQSLTYRADELDQPKIADLLLMTPHLFRATREGKDAVARLEKLNVTVDVVARVLTL